MSVRANISRAGSQPHQHVYHCFILFGEAGGGGGEGNSDSTVGGVTLDRGTVRMMALYIRQAFGKIFTC